MAKKTFDTTTDIQSVLRGEVSKTTEAVTGAKKLEKPKLAKVNFFTDIEDSTKLALIAAIKHTSQREILSKLLHDYILENEACMENKTVAQLAADIAAARTADND